MQLFFTAQTDEDKAYLDAEETRHCKVLRKNPGDTIHVINGQGGLMECVLLAVKKDVSELEIIERQHFPRSRAYYFHLLIAPTKQNERMEWMLEKAIEAGLDEITFIETEHSEKSRINMGRLEKIAISAMKQSGQFYLPKINPLKGFDQVNIDENTLIAHCGEGYKTRYADAVNPLINGGNIKVFIGPEGDFSIAEVNNAMSKGAKAISLGNSRLRTETAGLYCAIMLNGLG
jgi:16S rRNA (uracil1498-N3)-methyltransferase